jgi:3-oxoacyl-[acyl-carrier protein] reductase
MDLGLKDKVAIVTGSSRGLGLASAKSLAAEGCLVCVCGRTADTLAAAAKDVASAAGSPDRVLTVTADLSTPEGADAIVRATVERFGAVDVLVNNVGLGRGAGALDTPDEAWQEAFDHTLYPGIRASRAAIPHMKRRGGGVIVFVTSIYGREAGGRMVYNAVKSAENALAKSMAQQLAKDNIRVNAIAPGSISFPGGSWWKRQQDDPEGIAAFIRQDLPFGRFGRAEEIGDVVAFVCSPRASWISGACLNVDGCQSRSNI